MFEAAIWSLHRRSFLVRKRFEGRVAASFAFFESKGLSGIAFEIEANVQSIVLQSFPGA